MRTAKVVQHLHLEPAGLRLFTIAPAKLSGQSGRFDWVLVGGSGPKVSTSLPGSSGRPGPETSTSDPGRPQRWKNVRILRIYPCYFCLTCANFLAVYAQTDYKHCAVLYCAKSN